MAEQNGGVFGSSAGQEGGDVRLLRWPNGAVFGSSAGPNAGVFGSSAGPNGGVSGSSAGQNNGFGFYAPQPVSGNHMSNSSTFTFGCKSTSSSCLFGCSSSLSDTSPASVASRTQMPPTSIPVEINHKKVKKEAILNSPLPMILISRILKGIPQSPHFLQLRCYSGTARRNLEAAWDRTFEEAVEQIHELRASDFWAMARKLWKTMEELQSLGYNVFVPRKRVVELTDAMVKQNKRQNEIMVLKARAELHRMEKSKLESMILNLKARAWNAQEKMVESLIEAADKEKDLPEIENQIVDLASQPLKKSKLA